MCITVQIQYSTVLAVEDLAVRLSWLQRLVRNCICVHYSTDTMQHCSEGKGPGCRSWLGIVYVCVAVQIQCSTVMAVEVLAVQSLLYDCHGCRGWLGIAYVCIAVQIQCSTLLAVEVLTVESWL